MPIVSTNAVARTDQALDLSKDLKQAPTIYEIPENFYVQTQVTTPDTGMFSLPSCFKLSSAYQPKFYANDFRMALEQMPYLYWSNSQVLNSDKLPVLGAYVAVSVALN